MSDAAVAYVGYVLNPTTRDQEVTGLKVVRVTTDRPVRDGPYRFEYEDMYIRITQGAELVAEVNLTGQPAITRPGDALFMAGVVSHQLKIKITQQWLAHQGIELHELEVHR